MQNGFLLLPNNWEIIEKIGSGSYGTVYRAKRTVGSYTEGAAVKHISIPRNEDELTAICSELGSTEPDTIGRYLNETRDSLVEEYQQMSAFRGHTNIVACNDVLVIDKPDGQGYDILIWMELLTSLSSRIQEGKMNRAETIRLGVDLCSALIRLESRNVVHRDLKPQNIFVNEDGDYKLGDFGSARRIQGTSTFLSMKGTYSYLPPEVLLGRPANLTTDIYSLGLVLYRLMNNNLLPFLKAEDAASLKAMDLANVRRFGGEQLPPPANADPALAQIILKACAYKPEDRWQTAQDMLDALVNLRDHAGEAEAVISESKPRMPGWLIGLIVVVLVGIGVGIGAAAFRPNTVETAQNVPTSAPTQVVTEAPTEVLTEEPTVVPTEVPTEAPTATPTEAPTPTPVPDYEVEETEGGCKIIKYNGNAEHLLIPATLNNVEITEIGKSAFKGCTYLSSVKLPNTVEKIDNLAFSDCTSLTSISIPGNVKAIGDGVFYNCTSLTSVDIADGVQTFGQGVFVQCESLKSITIPDSVISMGATTDSVFTSGNSSTFNLCTSLEYVKLPSGLNFIGGSMFNDCSSLTEIVLPESVTKINNLAFSGCTSLTELIIPASVKQIGMYAFSDCTNLTSVTFLGEACAIDERAFPHSENLTFYVPGGSYVYEWLAGQWYHVEPFIESNFEIDNYGFVEYKGSAQQVVIPPRVNGRWVTGIDSSTFGNRTSLKSVRIPNGVLTIGASAFENYKALESVNIPDSVTSIYMKAFSGCKSLQSVVIPDSVKELGIFAFSNCTSLNSVTLSTNLPSLPIGVFSGCTSLIELTIPASVKKIHDYAFGNSTSLTLHVYKDTYAHTWAVENDFPHIVIK